MNIRAGVLTLLMFFLVPSFVLASPPEQINAPHVSLKLIHAPTSQWNSTPQIAVLFSIEAGWHLYWVNPGDSGYPPSIKWNTDQHADITDTQWAFPKAIPVSHLLNYGYEESLLLPSNIHIASSFKGETLNVGAKVSWLVCKETCIPGEAELSKNIHMTTTANESPKEESLLFQEWQKRIPQNISTKGSTGQITGQNLLMNIYATSPIFKHAKNVELFIKEQELTQNKEPVTLHWKNNWLRWEQELSEYLTKPPAQITVVVVIDQTHSYETTIPISLSKEA